MTDTKNIDRIFEFKQRLKAVRRELDSLTDDMNDYRHATLKGCGSVTTLDLVDSLCCFSICQGAAMCALNNVNGAERLLADLIEHLQERAK